MSTISKNVNFSNFFVKIPKKIILKTLGAIFGRMFIYQILKNLLFLNEKLIWEKLGVWLIEKQKKIIFKNLLRFSINVLPVVTPKKFSTRSFF